MSQRSLTGIGRIIKANTTEKSIDELRAEGKKRVRVVSSDRVMTIIQAIVDDTISREVGEIAKRDRDRIVGDTQERFSRVLKMQQDLEQELDDVRDSLRNAELERDRLRGEKQLMETQLETSRRADGDEDAVARLVREMARVRDAVERNARQPGTLDEDALARVVEKLTAREAQTARRLGAEFEDLRTRLDAAGRDATAARDAALEKAIQRVSGRQSEADAQFSERLERELRTVAERLTEMHAAVGRAPAADDAVARLRSGLDALESRIHGVEKSSSETADRVAKAVLARLQERDAAESERRSAAAAAETVQVAETLRRVQRSSDEARESLLAEVASLRESLDEARARPVNIDGEQVRDIEERIAASASETTGALARAVERVGERMASVGESLQAMRGDVTAAVDRAAVGSAAASQSEAAERFDGALAELRTELTAIAARGAEAAARQEEAIRALRENVAQSAAVQSGSLETTFKGALEQALDKITRTMERATARPIEMTGEATDVLLAKMFDVPDGEMTSNLDDIEVDERRSKASIAKSVGRLKEMNGRTKSGGK